MITLHLRTVAGAVAVSAFGEVRITLTGGQIALIVIPRGKMKKLFEVQYDINQERNDEPT